MYNDLFQSVDYMYRYKREINQTVQIAVDWVLRKAGQVVLNLVSQRSSSRHSVHSCKFKQNNKQTSSLLDSLASGEEKEHSILGKHPRSALLWQSPWEIQVKGAKVTWLIVSNIYVHDCLVSLCPGLWRWRLWWWGAVYRGDGSPSGSLETHRSTGVCK